MSKGSSLQQGFIVPFSYLSRVRMEENSSVLWKLLDWGYNTGVDDVYKRNNLRDNNIFISPWKLKFAHSQPAMDIEEREVDYHTVISMDGASNYLWNLIDFGYENGVNAVYQRYNKSRVDGFVSPWKLRYSS